MTLETILAGAARRLEVELKGGTEDLNILAIDLAAQLATVPAEEYEKALCAARDIIALRVGITAAELGDAADAELRSIIYGCLATMVSIL